MIVIIPLVFALFVFYGVVTTLAVLSFAFFGTDIIKYKGESSRLIRWPLAIKGFLASLSNFFGSIFFAVSVFFDLRLAKEVLQEIQTGQSRLPFEN